MLDVLGRLAGNLVVGLGTAGAVAGATQGCAGCSSPLYTDKLLSDLCLGTLWGTQAVTLPFICVRKLDHAMHGREYDTFKVFRETRDYALEDYPR